MFINEVNEGTEVIIKEIKGSKGLIFKMLGLGIKIGDKVKVLQNKKGPIIIIKDSIKVALGHGVGKKIVVEEVKEKHNETYECNT